MRRAATAGNEVTGRGGAQGQTQEVAGAYQTD